MSIFADRSKAGADKTVGGPIAEAVQPCACAGGRSYAYVEYRDRLGPSRSPFGRVAQCTVGHGQMSVSMPIHVERGSVAREFGQVMGCRGA